MAEPGAPLEGGVVTAEPLMPSTLLRFCEISFSTYSSRFVGVDTVPVPVADAVMR